MENTILNLAKLPLNKLQTVISSERRKFSDSSQNLILKQGFISCDGKGLEIKRVYQNMKKSYCRRSEVGWVISEEISECMNCSCSFDEKEKYHCYACGNVVCSTCCNNNAIVEGHSINSPQTACVPCYGEKAIATLKSSKNWGLPVNLSTLSLYGDSSISFVKSVMVIKAKNCTSNVNSYVNICISSTIERNTLDRKPKDFTSSLFYMVYGPLHQSVDKLDVHTVVIHHDELTAETQEEVSVQAINLVSRITFDKFSNPEVVEGLSYYSHRLTEIKNFKLLAATQRGALPKKHHGIKVLLPNKSIFEELYQVPTFIKEYEAWNKNQRKRNLSKRRFSLSNDFYEADKTIILRNGRKARSMTVPISTEDRIHTSFLKATSEDKNYSTGLASVSKNISKKSENVSEFKHKRNIFSFLKSLL